MLGITESDRNRGGIFMSIMFEITSLGSWYLVQGFFFCVLKWSWIIHIHSKEDLLLEHRFCQHFIFIELGSELPSFLLFSLI